MHTYMRSSSRNSKAIAAKLHIEEIRKHKFSIGERCPNPLTEDLQNAVANLSSELYTKDVHFLMELIQNAEDNEYSAGVKPTLEFVLTTADITGIGAPSTLLVFNNEVGFSKRNIDSLCGIGRSTKKGQRHQGFIGEKGIGFKSVFLVSALPHVFSNGYQIRFSEIPNPDCAIGYIVPEWVSTKPSYSDIQAIYGFGKALPNTVIILPLKPEKVEAVKKQLSEIHPEVLLFLNKIKRLSIQERSGEICIADSMSAVSISTETNLVSLKTQVADCRVVNLSVQEEADTTETTCPYYVWRQVFPVKPNNVVDARKDVKEWVISLAFPSGERLKRGTSSAGVFAFLPTAMVTNFPFIIQADFILSSSRETILLDNKWNSGILDNVPHSFCSAFTTFMKSTLTEKHFSVGQVLHFLPCRECPCKEINTVRQSSVILLQKECIVPYETFVDDKIYFCEPASVIRVLPEFRKIMRRIKEHGVLSHAISAQGKFMLHNSVDCKEYDDSCKFLQVAPAGICNDWYGKCIQACNLTCRASTEEYVDLLCFLAEKWRFIPLRSVNSIPLFKHITWNGEIKSCSLQAIRQESLKIHIVWEPQEHAWLNKWNQVMGCPYDCFFFPDTLVAALVGCERQYNLKQWFIKDTGLVVTTVSKYCSKLRYFLETKKDPKLLVLFSHFMYHSWLRNYIQEREICNVLHFMPVVDECGNVILCKDTLVPASSSKWIKLFGSNPFTKANCKYVELGVVYAEAAEFAGECTPANELLQFFKKHGKTSDLPDIIPQDMALQVASSQLTCEEALMLLAWIQNLRAKKYGLPMRFIQSIRNGKWVKTSSGFNTPTQCFLCDGTEESTLLEMGRTLKVLSDIDEAYYMDRIRAYKDELIFIGMRIGSDDMYQLISDHLKHLASSSMSKPFAILLLRFINCSNHQNKLDEDFLKSVKAGKWLKTNQGYLTPPGTVYLMPDMVDGFVQITDLHVVDRRYYENQLDCYEEELKFLGVVVDLEDVYKQIPEHFQFPKDLSILTKNSVFLLLGCIQHLGLAGNNFVQKIKDQPWLKTSSGFKCPSESLLPGLNLDHLLNIVPLPVVDEEYYGSRIGSYRTELEAIGVVVDINGACKMLSFTLKSTLSSSSLTSTNVFSLLNCIRCMNKIMQTQLLDIIRCLSGEKWLKTCHGYKSAPESILFDQKWGTVSKFVDLPFIDEAFYGLSIHSYKCELNMLGVVINFSEGAHFVARGLKLPRETASLAPEGALSLLQCATSLKKSCKSTDHTTFKILLNKLTGSKWLKTHMGYRFPQECILFNPDWECYLTPNDGPFIDEKFYVTPSSLEKEDLIAIGVKVDIEEACNLISRALTSHVQTSAVRRIYRFLYKFNWNPQMQDTRSSQLWIPDQQMGKGKWVENWRCVLHDQNNLFDTRLHALDKYYEKELLPFLSRAFGVCEVPSPYDFLDIWNIWEASHQVSTAKLSSFLGQISENWENWDSDARSILKRQCTMLPAANTSGAVQFVMKEEVFIADDLQLKILFIEASENPLFVWFPPKCLSSPAKLLEIYTSLGVRKISEAVKFDLHCTLSASKIIDDTDSLIGKALIKLVLAFANMPMEEKHKTAKSLLQLSVYGTEDPISVRYALQLPLQKRRLEVEIKKMVLWEKNSQRLLVNKSTWNEGKKDIKFIASFARAILEAVLPNSADQMDTLCRMIQMGMALGLEEDAVDYLLWTENLELSVEDKELLDRSFPSGKTKSSPVLGKRLSMNPLLPSTPNGSACRRRLRQKRN
ncbi:hypothetical protein CFP56_016885 [Quercus suber]|uniref:Sacsin/Nov domain-containing protein n=1 Tax=Quercus suber TaxID=58331 RepID=A0AAW0KNX4_QUESU|nr:uncharacterized protein LOC112016091 [Quercus suber]